LLPLADVHFLLEPPQLGVHVAKQRREPLAKHIVVRRLAHERPLQPFDVVLQSSGKMLHVPADRSLLEVLTDAGLFVTHDCRTGFCGLCSVTVLDGDIDHRDDYLLEADKAEGKVMQVCVSRAKSALLVLDL